MKVSTKGRYALRLMLDLAINDRGEPIRLKEVAERQQISEKYLEQIISVLNKAGFVSGIRGAQGGYRLQNDPGEYTVGMILRTTEKDLAPVSCVGEHPVECGRRRDCVSVKIWEKVNDAVNQVVDSVTLADMVRWHQETNQMDGDGRLPVMESGSEEEPFARTELLLGEEAMDRLKKARVAVFGIGGVGGYVCEALARSGVGALELVDHDKVCLTNLNRQIIATHKTLGQYKVEAMRERIHDINPGTLVRAYDCFFLPENAGEFPFEKYDYVVDAVDTVTAKIALVMRAREKGVPIISSMGAGNKLDGSQFKVADIYQTKVCPLARVMRRELKKRGVEKLKVVYSEEMPIQPKRACARPDDRGCGNIPGSTAFVPSVAGLLIAGEVVKDLVRIPE